MDNFMKGLNKDEENALPKGEYRDAKNIIYARPLRLGNLIISEDDYVVEVTEITWHTEGEYSSHWIVATAIFRDYQCNYPIDTYSYVPITEDWFSKAGFSYNDLNGDSGHWQIKSDIGIFEILQGEDGFFYEYKTEIKYVHELQNLYYALTKDELVFAKK